MPASRISPRYGAGPRRSPGLAIASSVALVLLLLLTAAVATSARTPNPGGTLAAPCSLRASGTSLGTDHRAPLTAARALAVESGVVQFGVQSLYVSVTFAPSISVANGTVGLGNRSDATVRFLGSNATVSVSAPGISGTNVSAPALGTQSVLVPGINDTVGGVPLSIYLEIFGQVNATTFVGANGLGGGVAITWSASGNRTVPFEATGPGHSKIEVGVTNLSYFLSAGVVAKGTVGGFPVSVNLLAPAPLPSAVGTPSTVVGVFEITAPPPAAVVAPPHIPAHASPAATPWWEVALLIGVPVLLLGVFIWLAFRFRATRRSPLPSACPACGHRIPRGASFCPGCAQPLLPTPVPPTP